MTLSPRLSLTRNGLTLMMLESGASRSKSTSPETNRKKSDVWNYFQKVGPKRVSCQLCSKQIAHKGPFYLYTSKVQLLLH